MQILAKDGDEFTIEIESSRAKVGNIIAVRDTDQTTMSCVIHRIIKNSPLRMGIVLARRATNRELRKAGR